MKAESDKVNANAQGTFDLPEQEGIDHDILSKSFAIPRSRNRVRGLL